MSTRRVLITAGPTREPIDPVRYISNGSSGRQGVAIARAAVGRGWQVDFVHGPLEVLPPAAVSLHPVETAQQMLEQCLELHPHCDVVIGAAAVSDFRPRRKLEQKQKRKGDVWSLELEPTVDILAALGDQKGERLHIGFALESQDLEANALEKLRRKKLDWIVANRPEAIGSKTSDFRLLSAGGERIELDGVSKDELAKRLWDMIERAEEGL